MLIKLTRALIVFVLSLSLQACEVEGFALLFTILSGGAVPTVPKDTDVIVGTLFRNVQTRIPPGQITASGKASAGGSGPATLKAAFPSQLRFTVQHKDSKNNLLATFTFGVTMDSDGKIPAQRFPFPGLVMNPNDSLLVSVTPLDADLPKSKLKMKLKYTES